MYIISGVILGMKDNIKKYRLPLIIMVLIISLCAVFLMTSSTAFHENPGTYAYFNKIAEMPHENHTTPVTSEYFWTYGGDCDERSREFRLYIESKGATNIQNVTVRCVKDGKIVRSHKGYYGHRFLLWNGKVYNPSLNKTVRFYGSDLEEYKKILKSDNYGFNTLYYENGSIESF